MSGLYASKSQVEIRLERGSQKQFSDTHETPYDRVKRCWERKINTKSSERVNFVRRAQVNSEPITDLRENKHQFPCHLDVSGQITRLPMKVKRIENGAAPECKGGENWRSPRKHADQRHRPARFSLEKIREDMEAWQRNKPSTKPVVPENNASTDTKLVDQAASSMHTRITKVLFVKKQWPNLSLGTKHLVLSGVTMTAFPGWSEVMQCYNQDRILHQRPVSGHQDRMTKEWPILESGFGEEGRLGQACSRPSSWITSALAPPDAAPASADSLIGDDSSLAGRPTSDTDTHKTSYDRVKRCRGREKNIKAYERVNVDVFTQNKRPCPQHSQTPFFLQYTREARWTLPLVIGFSRSIPFPLRPRIPGHAPSPGDGWWLLGKLAPRQMLHPSRSHSCCCSLVPGFATAYIPHHPANHPPPPRLASGIRTTCHPGQPRHPAPPPEHNTNRVAGSKASCPVAPSWFETRSEIGSKIDTGNCCTIRVQSWTGYRDGVHFEPLKLAVRNLDPRSPAIVDKCSLKMRQRIELRTEAPWDIIDAIPQYVLAHAFHNFWCRLHTCPEVNGGHLQHQL
ncbi:hypothetical protein PR048_022936 [Dryococelus australis]|uniref:Uncharacterized protein n=1 Tax=Dryococelus australis TaxID=614101 RepID=A0ABQ9GSR3_9NEOP|nr:hypothetical protein PR048_022936 [Dryococelus australis]